MRLFLRQTKFKIILTSGLMALSSAAPGFSQILPSVSLQNDSLSTRPLESGQNPSGPSSQYMPIGNMTEPPGAFLDFCIRMPDQCTSSRHEDPKQIIKLAARQMVEVYTGTYVKLETASIDHGPHNYAPDIEPNHLLHTDTTVPSQFQSQAQSQSQSQAQYVDGYQNQNSANQAPENPINAQSAALPANQGVYVDGMAAESPVDYQRVNLDGALMRAVDQLNFRVNRLIRPREDIDQYGRQDYWTVPSLQGTGYGDCEDYALQKRYELIRMGIPPEALSMAIVISPQRELHAVLILSAIQGDFVLDNLDYDIKPWQKTKYTWVSRQSPRNQMQWVSLNYINGKYFASRSNY